MEVDCELQNLEDDACLTWWIQENNAIIKRWKDTETTSDSRVVKQRMQQCYSDLFHLLMKLQGLPPTFPGLPLELTILYNAVIMHINVIGGFQAEHSGQLETALNRVLEASARGEVSDPAGTELWEKVIAADYPSEIRSALSRLAGLQCGFWLTGNHLEDVVDLLAMLSQAPVPGCKENTLLPLIKAWEVPHEEPETLLAVQSARHVKDILYTSAAFLQGVGALESLDFPRAVTLLQEAAGSLCSSRVLAEVYTCLGCAFYKMEKPQTALQYWKQALRVDFRCLPALYHSSCLYRHMGRTESELEALTLLHTALENIHPDPSSSRETLFLFRTELLLSAPILSRFICTPTPCEVRYLIASRCLRNRSMKEAVEHYMDLMADLQDGSQREGLYPSPAPLPRIPVIYLEAAAALLEHSRFQDAITVCAELLGSLGHVMPGIIRIDGVQTGQERTELVTEQLNSVLWASAAHLLQGEAQGMLGDHRESIIEFTRCINLLMKVQLVDSGPEDLSGAIKGYNVVGILRASAFLGRAHQFQQLGKQKNALMNVRLSLQVTSVFPFATSRLVNLLWKLGHKKEAACQWRTFQRNGARLGQQWEAVRRDLPLYLTLLIQRGHSADQSPIKELDDYVRNEEDETGPDSERHIQGVPTPRVDFVLHGSTGSMVPVLPSF